jgi:membrane protein DedA with SNARE-associated domain
MKKFIAYTTAGCLLWNVILIYLGWFLGKNWTEVAGITRYLIVVSAMAAIIAVIVYLLVRGRRMRQ